MHIVVSLDEIWFIAKDSLDVVVLAEFDVLWGAGSEDSWADVVGRKEEVGESGNNDISHFSNSTWTDCVVGFLDLIAD